MSDSILYLAIVAIWAGFLIPAWVRRPQSGKNSGESEFTAFDADAPVDDLVDADVAGTSGVAAAAGAGYADEGIYTYATEARYEDDVYGAGSYGDTMFETDTSAHPGMHRGNSEYRDDVHMHSYGQESSGSDGYGPAGPGGPGPGGSGSGGSSPDGRPVAGPLPPSPAPHRTSQSREQMMRARRRMLTILVSLVFITALFVLAGLVQWWICVPPIGMLALYVALLREIAIADAELAAKKRAWEARQATAEGDAAGVSSGSAWQQSHRAWEAAEADRFAAESEQSAEIIDISSRVGDQLYDQYADAAVRAVGD